MRRFTRLTNAFSKKVENHAAAIALHTMYYNFVRIHQTLRVTPAMAAGVSDKFWEVSDIVAMLGTMGVDELQAGIQFVSGNSQGTFCKHHVAQPGRRYDFRFKKEADALQWIKEKS